MRPHLLKIPKHHAHSFSIRHDLVPFFYNKWHYHPEIELVYFIQGSGRQFIGDRIHHFKVNDMILLGPNLPHLWRSDERYLEKDSSLSEEAIVIHFLPDCFGASFFDLPENIAIKQLLERSKAGIRVKNETREIVAKLMFELLNSNGAKRIVLLLDILQLIATSTETKTICTTGLDFHFAKGEGERLNNIYQYIFQNFYNQITLEDIAKVAHISPHAFCRYFKARTKKTFSTFLLEVRTGHAAKLLAETHDPVADICFNSGFNNFSNFNRHFKAIIGRTPLAHRKYYQEIRYQVITTE